VPSPKKDRRVHNLLRRKKWNSPDPAPGQPPLKYEMADYVLPEEYDLKIQAQVRSEMKELGVFGGAVDTDVAFYCTKLALCLFGADRQLDWDRHGEMRDARKLKGQKKRLAKLAKAVRVVRNTLEEIGDDGRARLTQLGPHVRIDADGLAHAEGRPAKHITPGAVIQLQDATLPRLEVAAVSAAWILEHPEGPAKSGKRASLALHRLVDRLSVIWDVFTEEPRYKRRGGGVDDHSGPWPFGDYVEIVLRPLGHSGKKLLRDDRYRARTHSRKKRRNLRQ